MAVPARFRGLVPLVALLVVCSGVGAAALPTAAVSPSTESPSVGSLPTADRQTGSQTATTATATYRVDPAGAGTLRVTVAVTVPDDAETVTVGFAPSTFQFRSWTRYRSGFDGSFEAVDAARDDAETYRWRVDGDRGELSYTVDANVSNVAFDGLDAAATDDWALVPTRLVFPGRVAVDGERLGADAVETEFGAYGDGSVDEGYAYFGAYDATRFDVPGGTVTAVVPAAVERPELNHLQRTVSAAATSLQVGGRDETVTAFVAPSGIRQGGRATGTDFWVGQNPPTDLPAHEYVHTRQTFEPGTGMRWFVEASAQYYGLRTVLSTDDAAYRSFRDALTDVDSGGTLNSPLRWDGAGTPYDKGALVLAALDAEIRRASDGDRTLQYVFARMNAHDGPVDESQFRTFVADAAGQPIDDWLDRYVAGSETPDLPDDESLYAFVESADADADGLTDRREVVLGTAPANPDTDGDDVVDGEDPEPLVPAGSTATTVEETPSETSTTAGTTTTTDPTTQTTVPSTTVDDGTDGTDGGSTDADTTADGSDGGSPGPGAVATLAAMLAGVWLAIRRRRR